MYKSIIAIPIALLLTSILLFPDINTDKKMEEAKKFQAEAFQLLAKKDVEGAIKKMEMAIKIVPDYHNFYSQIAYFYSLIKDYKNQYLNSKKAVDLYDAAKKRGEKSRTMTDVYYANHGAACVNYSLLKRNEGNYSEEIELLKEGITYYQYFIDTFKSGKAVDQAKDNIKIIEQELLPRAQKALKDKDAKEINNK